jgi:phosphatidylinositol glycan class W
LSKKDALGLIGRYSYFFVDLVVIVLPTVGSFTFPNSTFCLLVAAILLLLIFGSKWDSEGRDIGSSIKDGVESRHFAVLTLYRGSMMMCTCVAILAVDFPVFPRRFAKTETFGVSVMDLGVGSFVFSMGLVQRYSGGSGISYSPSSRLESSRSRSRYFGILLRALPIIALGLVRLFLVKSTDYQEHVTEYGVHWNFFFTLAAVSLFVSMLSIPPDFAALIGLLILTVYQAWLHSGLTEYILQHPRIDLLSSNREGIFSCLGYVAIFLVGQQVEITMS